jgi:stalled ribosome rescue protein Dom34
MTSNRHVAVWIDHDEARIFHVDAETIDEKTIRAPTHHVHRHPKGSTAGHDHPDDAHHFFQAVSRQLEGAERVLVVGPSTAKLQFIRYAYKHDRTLEPRIVGIETVDHPTDGQLVAYSKRYFAADDRMQGHPSAGQTAR